MGPFRSTGLGREIKTTLASFQWPEESNGFRVSRRCFFETPFRHDKCYIYCPGRTGSFPSRVMSVSRYPVEEFSSMPKRIKVGIPLVLGFSNEEKLGTIQPHDDALVVTLRIGRYDVKKGDD